MSRHTASGVTDKPLSSRITLVLETKAMTYLLPRLASPVYGSRPVRYAPGVSTGALPAIVRVRRSLAMCVRVALYAHT